MKKLIAILTLICLLALSTAIAEEIQFVDATAIEAPIDEIELELGDDIEDIVPEEVTEIDLEEELLSDIDELEAQPDVLAGAVANASGVAIDETNFPDEKFRGYVLNNCDTNRDGTLSEDEINAVTSIGVSYENIYSLKGIEFFHALTRLDCSTNHLLSSLDLSMNTALEYVDCSDTALTTIDISNCTALEYVNCGVTEMRKIDFSNCTALKNIDCESNNQLTALNLDGCTVLEKLNCRVNEQLTTLNLNGCTALEYLDCSYCELTELDISSCKALIELNCYHNSLTSLDIRNNTRLENLYCSCNYLSSLDVSKCSKLKELDCGSYGWGGSNTNQLTSLDLSECPALEKLNCSENELTDLNVSRCASLTYLICYSNQLTKLDASKCISLTVFSCGYNRLTALDISGCTVLQDLSCYHNSLTKLDISQCTRLERLSCEDNQLIKLDVSKCRALTELRCSNNQLTSLNVSNCKRLTKLYCYVNPLATLNVSKCPKLKNAVQKGSYTGHDYEYGLVYVYEYSPSNIDDEYVVACDTNVVITPKPTKAHIASCTVAIEDAVYTGKALKPAVTVKYGATQLKAGTDYTVSYKNNKKIGAATVIVNGKGSYVGEKTASFNIVPKAVTGLKLKAGKKQLTVSWKKASGVTGYQLEYSLKKNFSSPKQVSVSKAATVKKTLKNLKKGKTYYVRIRAYKDVNGQTYWSAWSAAKKAKVK